MRDKRLAVWLLVFGIGALWISSVPVMGQVATPEAPAVWGADSDWDWSESRQLAPGIEHRRWHFVEPRPMVVHALRVDSKQPGIAFHTTGRIEKWEDGEWEDGVTETRRQTVRNYLISERKRGVPMVAAVNADAFAYKSWFNRQDPTDLLGLAVSGGELVSSPARTPSLLVMKSGRLRIVPGAADLDVSDIEVAVSGFALCLEDQRPIPSGDDLHPRTGFGLSADGRFLLIMTIDGRQPESAGATTFELGQLLRRAGAATGINMDGGGSTTLAWWNDSEEPHRCELLNQPVGIGRAWPADADPQSFHPTERSNGNNFGISYRDDLPN
jgi:hypothetical protein